MKLSKKGAQKCFDKTYLDKQPIQAVDFEADDFKGVVVLPIYEAKNIYQDFASMYVIAKGTYPKDGLRKPFTLDILKMKIVRAEKVK